MLHVMFAKGFMAYKKLCSLDLGLPRVLGTAGSCSLEGATSLRGLGRAWRRVWRDPGCSEQGKPLRQGRVPHPVKKELQEVTISGLKPILNCSKGLESNSLTGRSWVSFWYSPSIKAVS